MTFSRLFKKTGKKLILFILIYLLTGTIVFASPQVIELTDPIGSISHKKLVSIKGTGFGTKSTPAPIRFDTFDSGETGSEIGSEGWWTDENKHNIHYSNLMKRSSHSKNNILAKYLVPDGRADASGMFYKADAFGGLAGKKFISMWVYIQFKNLNASSNWQLKIWRISTGPHHTDYVSTSLQSWWIPDGSDGWNYYELAGSSSGNLENIGLKEGQWMQLQWQLEDSSGIDVADAHITVTTLHSDGTRTKRVRNSWTSRTSTYPNPQNVPKFGYYLSNNINPGHEVWTYWDDIYIDNSWARIEIGNAPSYDSCTHREMQSPISWDSQNMQFEFNQGSFTEGQTAYIFVIDENGIPNETGFPITIGNSLPAPTIKTITLTY